MFMRNNRSKNGVPQPETVSAATTGLQRKSRKLAPNFPLDGSPEDWRFDPDLSSCDRINDSHYDAGVSSDLFLTDYERSVPYVGTPDTMSEKDRKLHDAP